MTQPWQFDENQPWVPASLRTVCSIPETIKTQGQLNLHPGEEGFLTGESSDGLWGVATFKRESHEEAINVLIPMNRIIKGAPYRSLQDKLNDRPPTMNQIANVHLDPPWTHTSGTWRNFQKNIRPIRSRGLPSRLVDTVFNHPAFAEQSRLLLMALPNQPDSGCQMASLPCAMLILRPITASYPTKNFQEIYVRFYTNMAGFDPDVVGVYVGQSQTSLWGQQQDHDGNTDGLRNKSPHYNIARCTSKNCRYAVPIILFDRTQTLDSIWMPLVFASAIIALYLLPQSHVYWPQGVGNIGCGKRKG
ncbi:unnamed protein product [Fusarium graminearum]|nr:unnamed protein product [Fusarium graminearum]